MQLSPIEVRALRHKFGLTQAELARRLGLNPDAVRAWESGKAPCKGPAAILLKLWGEDRAQSERTTS